MKKDDFTVFIIIVIIRQWDERGMEWRYQSAASISDLPQNGLCLSFGHHSKSFMDLLTVLCVKLPLSSSASPTSKSLQVHRSSFCGGSYHYTLVVQLPPFIQVIRLQGHSMKKKSIIMIIKSIIRVWVHTLNFDGSVPLSHGWDFLFNWLTLR